MVAVNGSLARSFFHGAGSQTVCDVYLPPQFSTLWSLLFDVVLLLSSSFFLVSKSPRFFSCVFSTWRAFATIIISTPLLCPRLISVTHHSHHFFCLDTAEPNPKGYSLGVRFHNGEDFEKIHIVDRSRSLSLSSSSHKKKYQSPRKAIKITFPNV